METDPPLKADGKPCGESLSILTTFRWFPPAFLAFFYLHLWLRVDPGLMSILTPTVQTDTEFLREHATRLGGISAYVSHLLFDLQVIPWAGALGATLLAAFACCCVQSLATGGRSDSSEDPLARHLPWISTVPALLALVAYNRYFPLELVEYLSVAVSAMVFARIRVSSTPLRYVCFLGIFLIQFYFAPKIAWLFATTAGMWEATRNRNFAAGAACAATGLLAQTLMALYVENLREMDVWRFVLPFLSPPRLTLRLLLLGCMTAAGLAVAIRKRSGWGAGGVILAGVAVLQSWFYLDVSKTGLMDVARTGFNLCIVMAPGLPAALDFIRRELPEDFLRARNRFAGLLVFVVFLVIVQLTFDEDSQAFLRINLLAQNGKWEEALQKAREASPSVYRKNPILFETIHRTLFLTGKLQDNQFGYPMSKSWSMNHLRAILDGDFPQEQRVEIGQTYFLLGLVNHADRMAWWALEDLNESARAYQLIVKIFLVKENPAAARVVLNHLRKSFRYRAWAQRYLALAAEKCPWEHDAELAQARSRMIKRDDPADDPLLLRMAPREAPYDYEGLYRRLLAENPGNRMAFEYLMSFHLLNGRVDKVMENLPLLPKFGYAQMPAHYQEALLICMDQKGEADANRNAILSKHGWRFSDQVLEKHRLFLRILNRHSIPNPEAMADAFGDLGGSYFAYYLCAPGGRP
jgi:hypothetical protein